MDWSKTKTIFILAFLLLNIILGWQIYTKQTEYLQDTQTTNSTQELANIVRLQQINITGPVPKEIPDLYFIQVKKTEFYQNSKLVEPIRVETSSSQKQITSKLQKTIRHLTEYEYDHANSSIQQIVYNQRIEGYPYFGSSLILPIIDGETIAYSQDYYQVVERGPNRQVISANAALRTALDHQLIPKNSDIQEIQLGFYKQAFPEDIQVFVPVWRIVYVNDQAEKGIVYINAMTGGVEQTEGIEEKEIGR